MHHTKRTKLPTLAPFFSPAVTSNSAHTPPLAPTKTSPVVRTSCSPVSKVHVIKVDDFCLRRLQKHSIEFLLHQVYKCNCFNLRNSLWEMSAKPAHNVALTIIALLNLQSVLKSTGHFIWGPNLSLEDLIRKRMLHLSSAAVPLWSPGRPTMELTGLESFMILSSDSEKLKLLWTDISSSEMRSILFWSSLQWFSKKLVGQASD